MLDDLGVGLTDPGRLERRSDRSRRCLAAAVDRPWLHVAAESARLSLPGRQRAHEDARVAADRVHPDPVAEQRPTGAAPTRRIHRDHGDRFDRGSRRRKRITISSTSDDSCRLPPVPVMPMNRCGAPVLRRLGERRLESRGLVRVVLDEWRSCWASRPAGYRSSKLGRAVRAPRGSPTTEKSALARRGRRSSPAGQGSRPSSGRVDSSDAVRPRSSAPSFGQDGATPAPEDHDVGSHHGVRRVGSEHVTSRTPCAHPGRR